MTRHTIWIVKKTMNCDSETCLMEIQHNYDKMHENMKKTKLWCKIIPKIGVEQTKSNVRKNISIYKLLGT